MANEIQFSQSDYNGGRPLYFVAYAVSDGRYVIGSSLEAYNAADWQQYAVALTLDATNGVYNGDFPAVPDGLYYVTIFAKLGSTAATTDQDLAEGEYQQAIEPAAFTSQMQIDAGGFISDFAEPITYQAYDNSNNLIGTYYINAVVNRNPPAAIQEDGKVLSDDIEINIANDLTAGRNVINKGRDKIIVSGRYGGAAKPHIVALIASGDQGVWTLRVK